MYDMQDSFDPLVWIFFVSLTLLNILVMNLFLVTIAFEFNVVQTRQRDADRELREQINEDDILPMPSFLDTVRWELQRWFGFAHDPRAELIERKVAAEEVAEKEKEEAEAEKEAIEAEEEEADEEFKDPLEAAQKKAELKQNREWEKIKNENCFFHIVNSQSFGNFLMFFIIACVVAMMVDPPVGQNDLQVAILAYCNLTFSWVFIMECLFKILAYGFKGYFAVTLNQFDFLLVINSIIEMVSGGGVMVLRLLRLTRVSKLLRFMPQVNLQVNVIIHSLNACANFCILLGLFIFIFSVLGCFLFGGAFDLGTPANFDNIFRAFLVVFQVITLDWASSLEQAWASKGVFLAVLYFFTLVVAGNYILINLFIAILLDSFAVRAREEEEIMLREIKAAQNNSPEAVRKLVNFKRQITGDNAEYMFSKWKIHWEKSRDSELEKKKQEANRNPST